MSTHKNIDRVCVVAVVLSLLLSVLFVNAEALGVTQAETVMGYESRLFDTSRVHTIDIVIDDWDSFLSTAQSEEYSECAAVIDGEAYKNIAIRGKGNTSLSNVASMDSDRYSFKIEFDHYDSNKSYHGLDKLSLNNIIQDNTYMKDYLTYRMMGEFGVSAPLCSYAYITVNGEDWGLYLAVEGVEDSFLQRNYGNNYGELYKPDSMSFGGGRGNGKEFSMDSFMNSSDASAGTGTESSDTAENSQSFGKGRGGKMQGGFDPSAMSDGSFDPSAMFGDSSDLEEIMDSLPDEIKNQLPEDFSTSDITASDGSIDMEAVQEIMDSTGISESFKNHDMGGFGGGMGSSDVKLQYSDDSYDSYSNIFDNAKTDITDEDKDRLIASLKSLSAYENIESVVDVEAVIRYFVVHNYVCNGDSYTGSMIHNYYLYEENGQLSMIPWDYNLAFGTFQSGNAQSEVNSPIDSPVSGDMTDRPMVGWIFDSEEYTELYHQYFAEFLNSVDITGIIDEAAELIAPYVEKDPTKFCTYEEFEKGVETLRSFCQLRSESVAGQLNGTIPSTTDGQNADSSALIDASSIKLSDMGTMSTGGGMDKGGFSRSKTDSQQETAVTESQTDIAQLSTQFLSQENSGMPQMGEMPQGGMEPPEGFDGTMPEMPAGENGEMPEMPAGENGQMPDFGNMQIPTDENGNPVMQNPMDENAQTPATEAADDNETSEAPAVQEGEASSEQSGETPDIQNAEMPDMQNGNASEQNGGTNTHSRPDSDMTSTDFSGGQFPQSGGNTDSNIGAWIITGATALFLIGGLVFAFKFKR